MPNKKIKEELKEEIKEELKEESLREVPKTNYYILVALIVLIISLCTATYNIYSIYQEYKYNKTSPLSTNKQVDYTEISSTINEMQEDTFLVISYTGDEDIRQNEKNLRVIFRKYELLENIIYVDVESVKDDENFLEDINSALGLTGDLQIEKIPSIVYFKEGTVKAIAKSKNGIIDEDNVKTIIKNNINVD